MSPEFFSDPLIELLFKGLSFCPTPASNPGEFDHDLYDFTRKLRLKYQFHNHTDNDISIVKLPSSYVPPSNQDPELERVIHDLKEIKIHRVNNHINNNLSIPLKEALRTLQDKVDEGELVIKSADKGDVTVVMSSNYYYSMCMRELNKSKFYRRLGKVDPSNEVKTDVISFANTYRTVLTAKEYRFLTEKEYKMAYFYSLPKLHKSPEINERLKNGSEYVHLHDYAGEIEGRPIVGGPAFHTSGISEMIDIILKPIMSHIPHILTDSFDFVDRCSHTVPDGALMGTADIKALYTNLSKELVFRAIEYWFNRYVQLIPILQRFGLNFILDGLEIILKHNYFLFADVYFQQIHGFAMGTKAAVNCANLGVGYLEVQLFDQLPQHYPYDFVKYFIDNYFRFLDDVDYSWLQEFDVEPFQRLCNDLDPNLKFIFSKLAKECDFLDVHARIIGYELELDIYRKPTDSYNYLHYSSSHPHHTRNNIALSLAKRIIRIASHNRDARLDELMYNLISRGHPKYNVLEAFSKVFSPAKEKKTGEVLVFTTTHNPSQSFPKSKLKNCLRNASGDSLNRVFKDSHVIVGTRQPKSLRQFLIRSKFSRKKIKDKTVPSGLFNCRGCKYHRLGYIKRCQRFVFGKRNQFMWEYRRQFNCNSTNVIYVLKCRRCWKFYIGETKDLKKRTRKHKSDVFHPRNSYCRALSEHLRRCSLASPQFHIFPIMYVKDQSKRRFIEKRLISQYEPPLNIDG